ncbi:MAG: hypothetical protein IIB13_06730 [Chloroflexi bacterium]|nr:hypothetical protein [Chloroflexota bacterium]
MPMVGGTLEILAGFGMLASAYFFLALMYIETPWPWSLKYFLSLFIPSLGILSVVGGVFALKRRKWRLAFAGAAAAIPLLYVAPVGLGIWAQDVILRLYIFVLGFLLAILPIALLRLSKREFT